VGAFAGDVLALAPWNQPDLVAASRAELKSVYGLDAVSDYLVGRSIAVDPWDTAVAFAVPGARWAPLPTLQTYAAFTKRLDEENAAFLRSAMAPETIVRASPVDEVGKIVSVDGRNPWFESPAAMLESLCRYRSVAISGMWQILERTSSTCGDPVGVSTVSARAGELVPVPTSSSDRDFVIVRIRGLDDSPFGTLRAILWKGVPWYIRVDSEIRYRLIAGTADDGLIMAVPTGVRSTAPFDFGPATRVIQVSAGEDGRGSSAALEFEFLRVPWNQQR
jgi:hypothetical protein